MPTGYTHAVQDGKISEFEDFVWVCARGMGALIDMRDDRADAPIPERFEPSVEYHDNAIVKAQARLQELDGMSPISVREAAHQAYAEKVKGDDGYEAKKQGWRERYEAMLAKVQVWEPPTQDHVGFKSFMIDQLRQSIDFDCSDSFYDPPKKLDPADWHRAEVQKSMRDVAYHTAERAKEVERTEERNRWLAQLRESLKTRK